MTQTNIPTLADLHHSPDIAYKKDGLKFLLSHSPTAEWLKKNKYAQNAEYLPIDKVEYLLDRIFQEWKVEVLKTGQLLNSVEVTVRLNYIDPVTGLWKFHDGVGAKELQTKSETGHLKTDLSNIAPGAVEMALPIAKSKAIRDAADHLGRLFGRDLNRKDTISDFVGSYSNAKKEAQPQTTSENYTL